MSHGSSYDGGNATCNVVISFITSQKPMPGIKIEFHVSDAKFCYFEGVINNQE